MAVLHTLEVSRNLVGNVLLVILVKNETDTLQFNFRVTASTFFKELLS